MHDEQHTCIVCMYTACCLCVAVGDAVNCLCCETWLGKITSEAAECDFFYGLCHINPTGFPSVNSHVLSDVGSALKFCFKGCITHLALKAGDKV